MRTSTSVRTFSIFRRVRFFLQPISELVALVSELGGKVKSLEQNLETVKATFSQNIEELTKSCEEQHALKGELDQIHNVAQLVVSEIFGSVLSTSRPLSSWRRSRMRSGPSSQVGYSTERRGC